MFCCCKGNLHDVKRPGWDYLAGGSNTPKQFITIPFPGNSSARLSTRKQAGALRQRWK
jgi:hypothetical protein